MRLPVVKPLSLQHGEIHDLRRVGPLIQGLTLSELLRLFENSIGFIPFDLDEGFSFALVTNGLLVGGGVYLNVEKIGNRPDYDVDVIAGSLSVPALAQEVVDTTLVFKEEERPGKTITLIRRPVPIPFTPRVRPSDEELELWQAWGTRNVGGL